MKNFLLVFLFLIAAASSQVIITDEEKAWVMFQERYNRCYSTPEEVMLRKGFFMKNYKDIIEHNKENSINGTGFILNMNHFTDRSREELLQIITCGQDTPDWPLKKSDLNTKTQNLKPPFEIDWVKRGKVSAVKDQKECCASYAFATLGQLESALAIQNQSDALDLSAQEIVDCAGKTFHDACRGGFLSITIKYGLEKGVHFWEAYPYTGCRGPCHKYVPGPHPKIKRKGEHLFHATDLAIMYALDRQPITAHIDATPQSFIHYSSGIYHDDKCNKIRGNHYVLIVGYGVEFMYSTPYWKIKNSWSKDWGEDGYMRMTRGSNTCGIRNLLYIDVKMV